MRFTSSLFSQILRVIPRAFFLRLVHECGAERHAKGFSSWDQYVAMLFCQLAQAKSLREIEDPGLLQLFQYLLSRYHCLGFGWDLVLGAWSFSHEPPVAITVNCTTPYNSPSLGGRELERVCCCDTSFSSAMPYLWILSNLGCNNNSGKTKLLVKHNQEDEPDHAGDSGQEERWGKRSSRVQ